MKKETKHTEETKKRISESLKGRKHTEEHIKKIISSRKWYKPSKETKRKMSRANKGKPSTMKGKKRTEETKEKMRKATLKQFKNGMPKETREKLRKIHKGREQTEGHIKKRVRSRKGYKHSEEIKRKIGIKAKERCQNPEYLKKMSKALKGFPAWNKGYGDYMVGEKNPRWLGGKFPYYYGSNWRKQQEIIRTLANNCCKECGIKPMAKLDVHHIRPFRSFVIKFALENNVKNMTFGEIVNDMCGEANDLSNLMAVCRQCHQKLERKTQHYLFDDLKEGKKILQERGVLI